jgi:gluconokinase
VAAALAQRIGGDWVDADDFHPPANLAKLAAGVPLTDGDRAGWLGALADRLRQGLGTGRTTVLACSALKEAYREVLRVDPGVRFLYLKGSRPTIQARLAARKDHFMNPALLDSQFATLEEPACGPGTDGWEADITEPTPALVDRAIRAFGLGRRA